MRTLTPRTIDWIDRAPVQVTRTRRIEVGPDRVFEVLADHERWPEWFGALTRVEVPGTGEGVGGGRRVHIRSIVVDEEFLAWDPGRRFAFTLTHSSAPGIRSMVEDIRLTPDGEHATTVAYTQAIEPVAATVTAPLLRRLISRAIDDGLRGLARHLDDA